MMVAELSHAQKRQARLGAVSKSRTLVGVSSRRVLAGMW